MKAILVIYLNLALGFSEGTSVSIYHAFNVFCYFTPILGAMLADGWLGKFRTILYVSVFYALGNVVMTVTAIPINGEFIVWSPFIGLVIIAIGTGGIKPCVSSFGGDQFSPTQQRQKDSFFSLFYMAINVGSLLSTIITPLIRSNVSCFGMEECYALAFGIPAILMVVAIVLFAIGSRWYTKIPPGESIIIRMFGCIGTALSGKCSCKKQPDEKKDHWLDYAEPKYDKRFIADVKDVMSVCWLFIPLPVFWALFDQQGSRWTLQAKKLHGDFGGFVMQPDMMQVLNALLVVIMVPILESLVYPCLDKFKIPNRPLQRMSLGMILAATAFLMAGFLQLGIDNESPPGVTTGQIKLNFVNTGKCPVTIMKTFGDVPEIKLEGHMNTEYFYVPHNPSDDQQLTFTPICDNATEPYNLSLNGIEDKQAYQILINETDANIYVQEKVDYTLDLESSFRVYNMLEYETNIFTIQGSVTKGLYNVTSNNMSEYQHIKLNDFIVDITYSNGTNVTLPNFKGLSKNGAVYTILLYNNDQNVINMTQLMDIPARAINIFIQVPQYIVMTLGECLFSVTGLGFAYSQASPSMKSILTAIWLLTVAVGNVVVVIIAETGSSLSQMVEFFLFSGLMYVTTVIFAIMCLFYKYVEPRAITPSDSASTTTSGDENENDKKNMAFSVNDEEIGVISKTQEADRLSHRSNSSKNSSSDTDTRL